ncbi:MAG: hypothetical protein ACK5D8_03460, partial [Bacteroidota bacterium]
TFTTPFQYPHHQLKTNLKTQRSGQMNQAISRKEREDAHQSLEEECHLFILIIGITFRRCDCYLCPDS